MKALSSRPRVCGKIRLTSKHTRIGLHLSVSVCAPMCAFMRVCMQSCYVYVCVCVCVIERERVRIFLFRDYQVAMVIS